MTTPEGGSQFQDHANSYCWNHKLFKYPDPLNHSRMPYELNLVGGQKNMSLTGEDVGEINFYRWITVMFVVQALFFKIPSIIWNACNEASGTQIRKIVSVMKESTFKPQAEKNRHLS